MADTLILKINLAGDADALARLQNLDAAAKSLRQPIKIKVNGAASMKQDLSGVATNAEKAAGAMEKLGKAAEGTRGRRSSPNLLRVLGDRLAYTAISAGINMVTKSISDAFDTMKQVDKELATIQKVTGRSRAEMEKLGDSAYSTASKYGVAAQEYLESVGTFARAGYGDMADQLGELAIKTQLVGDVSAEVADRFLLSVDAAYKYGGSVEKLSTVLDKANAVENNFATSIEKLAEGMPIVANVAATANMSIEETIAMLGTITAVTQESGTKAATAARALILNIMGDTTTEIEEGVRLTGEQVNDLRDILWKYSREAMETAQATGKIVDPMEAVAGLAKAAQEGLLTEQELARIASDIGGKLRTNQLLALINNWDMFNAQLDTMKNSAGSADAEIGIMLDTWDAKSKQLKNSWTQMVATIADTDLVKGALDVLRGGFDFINDAVQGKREANRYEELSEQYKSLYGQNGEYEQLLARAEELTTVEQMRLDYLRQQKMEMEEQLAAQNKAKWDEWQTQHETTGFSDYSRQDAVDLGNYRKELQKLYNTFADDRDIKTFESKLGELNQRYQQQYEAVAQMREDGYEGITESQTALTELMDTAMQAQAQMNQSGDELNGVFSVLVGMFQDSGLNLEESISAATEAMAELFDESRQDIDIRDNLDEAKAKAEDLSKALDEATRARTATVRVDVWNDPSMWENSFASGTKNAPGGPALVNELGPELISANGLAWIAGGGEPTVTELPRGAVVLTAQQTRRALKGRGTMRAMPAFAAGTGFMPYVAIGDANAFNGGVAVGSPLIGTTPIFAGKQIASGSQKGEKGPVSEEALDKALKLAEQYRAAAEATSGMRAPFAMIDGEVVSVGGGRPGSGVAASAGGSGTGGGGGSSTGRGGGRGGSGAAAKDLAALQKGLDDALKNLRMQAELADNRGEHQREGDLYGQAQDKIREMMAEYRNAGYSETSDEVLKLQNLLYDYAEEQEKAYKHLWDELEKGLDDALGNINAQIQQAENADDLQKQAALYGEAQDKISALLEQYRKAGYSETSDEVLKLSNLLYDYGEKQKQALAAAWDRLEDGLSKTLGNLDAQAQLAQNEGNTAREGRIYAEAQQYVKGLLEKYRAAGYSETSDEVLRLRNLLYDYAERQVDANERVWAAVADELDRTLGNLDAQAQLAQNRGDTAAQSGLYGQAQEKIRQTLEKYRAAGYSETSDEVLRLQNLLYDYAEREEEARQKVWDELEKGLDDALSNISARITKAQNEGDVIREMELYGEAQEKIAELLNRYLEAGYSPDSDEVLKLTNLGYDYAAKQTGKRESLFEELIAALEGLKDSTDQANALSEKQNTLDKAREALDNAQRQRTVRIFNPVTGQWEWVANAADVQAAQERLMAAEKDLADTQLSRAIQEARESGDASGLIAGDAVSALFAGAGDADKQRILDALNAYTGTAGFNPTMAPVNNSSRDSHDTNYYFGNVEIPKEKAEGMTLAELARELGVLGLV